MEHDPTTRPTWRYRAMGEAAVLLEGNPTTMLVNRSVIALKTAFETHPIDGVQSLVPGISSLLVRFDPLITSAAVVETVLQNFLDQLELPPEQPSRTVTIPVRYGGKAGPDLEAVAAQVGLSPREVVEQHCGRVYQVLVIGFAPGFPYIGPLPPTLTLPRRATPRTAVPAGSVAIAAGLTGIYPDRLPGGWHLIGTTPLRLFDPRATPPILLAAGDSIRFEPLREGVVP